jgi:hypothetical protein
MSVCSTLSRQWLDCDSLPVHRTCCGKEQRTVKCKDLSQERSAGGLSIPTHVQGRAYLVGVGDARSCRAEDYAYERHRKLAGSNPSPLAVSGAFANVTALRDNSSVTGVEPRRCTAWQTWIVEDDRGVPGPRERLGVHGGEWRAECHERCTRKDAKQETSPSDPKQQTIRHHDRPDYAATNPAVRLRNFFLKNFCFHRCYRFLLGL